jgi:hypothetical protein
VADGHRHRRRVQPCHGPRRPRAVPRGQRPVGDRLCRGQAALRRARRWLCPGVSARRQARWLGAGHRGLRLRDTAVTLAIGDHFRAIRLRGRRGGGGGESGRVGPRGCCHCRGQQVQQEQGTGAERRCEAATVPGRRCGVEVVLLSGWRVVAFETVTRRRREAVLPVPDQPAAKDWGAVEYIAHTNTLALVGPVVFMEPPDDQVEVSS